MVEWEDMEEEGEGEGRETAGDLVEEEVNDNMLYWEEFKGEEEGEK